MPQLRAPDLAAVVTTRAAPWLVRAGGSPERSATRRARARPHGALDAGEPRRAQRATMAVTRRPVSHRDDGVRRAFRDAQVAVVAGVRIDGEQAEERVGLGQGTGRARVLARAAA